MPLLRKATPEQPRQPVLAPIEGLDYSAPSTFINYRNGFPVNMRVLQGDIRKREGSSALGSVTISGANGIIHLGIYPKLTEAIRLLRMSKTTVEKYNPGSGAWDSLGGSLTGSDTDFISDAVAQNTYVFTNWVNQVRKYTDTGNVQVLAGSPPKCKFLSYLSPYLVAGYVELGDGNHQKVQWTDNDDIEDWSTGNASSAILNAHGATPLRGLKVLNEVDVAYMKDAIYLGRPVDTSEVIKWDLVETGSGLAANRAVSEQAGRHYYMDTHSNDFRMFDGVRSESIGKSVRDFVFPFRNANYDNSAFAIPVLEYDEIWFFVVMQGKTFPQDIWKYNYRYGYWYFDTCDNFRAAAMWFSQSSLQINQLVGTINAQANRIDDYLGSTNSPTYIFGSDDGKTYKLDRTTHNDAGVAVDARFDSIDFKGDKFEQLTRWQKIDFWAKGVGSVTLSYSTDYGSTWTSVGSQTLTSAFKRYTMYFDTLSERIRFRWANSTLAQTFSLRQFYPYYLDREGVVEE